MVSDHRQAKANDAAANGKGESGFTLVELLVVILVIGILAAIVILDLSKTTSGAASASCNADVKTVESAVEAFHNNSSNIEFGSYPNSTSATPSGNTQLTAPVSSNYGGPYLRTWPNSSHYTITLGASGHVLVDGKDYDDSATNPCSTVG